MTHEGASQVNMVESIIVDAIAPGSDKSEGLNSKDREDISCLFLEVIYFLMSNLVVFFSLVCSWWSALACSPLTILFNLEKGRGRSWWDFPNLIAQLAKDWKYYLVDLDRKTCKVYKLSRIMIPGMWIWCCSGAFSSCGSNCITIGKIFVKFFGAYQSSTYELEPWKIGNPPHMM